MCIRDSTKTGKYRTVSFVYLSFWFWFNAFTSSCYRFFVFSFNGPQIPKNIWQIQLNTCGIPNRPKYNCSISNLIDLKSYANHIFKYRSRVQKVWQSAWPSSKSWSHETKQKVYDISYNWPRANCYCKCCVLYFYIGVLNQGYENKSDQHVINQEPMSMQLHYISVTVLSYSNLFLDRIPLE